MIVTVMGRYSGKPGVWNETPGVCGSGVAAEMRLSDANKENATRKTRTFAASATRKSVARLLEGHLLRHSDRQFTLVTFCESRVKFTLELGVCMTVGGVGYGEVRKRVIVHKLGWM